MLPTKWCIKPNNEKERDIVFSFDGIKQHNDARNRGLNNKEYYYQHYPAFQGASCTASVKIELGYTEIDIKTFKRDVLMIESEPIVRPKEDLNYLIDILKGHNIT